jgi:glycosyltransferase involved in cell wall biosynthesis
MTAVADPASSASSVSRPSAARKLRLAYLTNRYPSISHTFIRRELMEMERRGHSVLRLAIRPAESSPVDPVDIEEGRRTTHCLAQPKPRLFLDTVLVAFRRPGAFLRAVGVTRRLAKRSGVGLVRHIAYLVEACSLLRIVQRERIEHLHAHFGTNGAAVALLLRVLGGPPYSLTIHGSEEFDSPVALSLDAKVAAAAFVVGISHFGTAQIKRWIPFSQWGKVHMIGCSVGPSFFDAAAPVDPASRTFVCVGRLSSAKGHVHLIDAFSALIRSGADANLVLAGDGELRAEIESRIASAGLRERVAITGWIDEARVRELILRSRAVVLSSFAEGLPMVLMEAFALGRPVIATSVAGIPELVKPGQSGWLAIAGDSVSLVSAMRECLAAPAERLDAMAAAGRTLVIRDHDTATETAKLEALIVESLTN